MTRPARRTRLLVLGAAGRDFHDFPTLWRDDPSVEVVAFTAAQIPGIAGRRLPPELSGPLYPEGIPIEDESGLAELIRDRRIDRVAFAYSDVSHAQVMHLASVAIAAGAEFVLPSAPATMLPAAVPVIAVCAVRTGCGKSQVARRLSSDLAARGLRVAVLRHPMPYGDLARQAVQRFATLSDLAAADCTVEEREEYEPHLREGHVVYSGVDCRRIAEAAAAEADLILWDGGNNDLPFLKPDLPITLVDPLRPGDESAYHPGETALRLADVILVAKTNAATTEAVARTEAGARAVNPCAAVVRGASRVTLDDPEAVRGRRVLVVEDGPTITHGGMPWGAGWTAARAAGAADILDPRAAAVGPIAEAYRAYPHIGRVLPALGYGPAMLEALRETIAGAGAEAVVIATPCDLAALIDIPAPVVRARYDYADAGTPTLWEHVAAFLDRRGVAPRNR